MSHRRNRVGHVPLGTGVVGRRLGRNRLEGRVHVLILMLLLLRRVVHHGIITTGSSWRKRSPLLLLAVVPLLAAGRRETASLATRLWRPTTTTLLLLLAVRIRKGTSVRRVVAVPIGLGVIAAVVAAGVRVLPLRTDFVVLHEIAASRLLLAATACTGRALSYVGRCGCVGSVAAGTAARELGRRVLLIVA